MSHPNIMHWCEMRKWVPQSPTSDRLVEIVERSPVLRYELEAWPAYLARAWKLSDLRETSKPKGAVRAWTATNQNGHPVSAVLRQCCGVPKESEQASQPTPPEDHS